MHSQTISALAVATALCVAGLSAQAADTFKVDPDHTNIIFSVNHLGYSDMFGQFNKFEGEFVFDDQDVSKSKVSIVVDTASVDTDHQKRDDHLRSPDFFNASEFPEMTFTSKSIEKTGDNTGKINGELTMLGVTRPISLDVTFNKKAPHPLPQYNGVLVAGFSARGSVKRSDFGMKYGVPNLGDEITFFIEVEGHKK
ncbi:MAG: YceI family protein [Alphaproteobacteria bacterium]|nr:YceI family protein [Alphaproteobacteria bacterium]